MFHKFRIIGFNYINVTQKYQLSMGGNGLLLLIILSDTHIKKGNP